MMRRAILAILFWMLAFLCASAASAQDGTVTKPRTGAAGSAPARTCNWSLSGPLTTLIRGARTERIGVTIPKKCAVGDTNVPVVLSNQGVIVRGELQKDAAGAGGRELALQDVAAELQMGAQTFTIARQDTNETIAQINLSVGSINTSAKLAVVYDGKSLPAHSGESAIIDNRPVAVVGTQTPGDITNVAALQIPGGVPTTFQGAEYWVVDHSSWGDDVKFSDCIPMEPDSSTKPNTNEASHRQSWESGPCAVASMERLAFNVSHLQAQQLVVYLQLVPNPKDRAILEISVVLAGRARQESVPLLHLASALQVSCDPKTNDPKTKDNWYSTNTTIAIDNDALEQNKCYIAFNSLKLTPTEQGDIEQYGVQPLQVRVHRNGTETDTDVRLLWLVSPKKCSSWTDCVNSLPIPAPKTSSDGDAAYHVDVQLVTVPDSSRVTYRSGVAIANDGADFATGRFSVTLRPKGPFAWSGSEHSVRTFVTIPLNITGIRFPVSAVDLRTSSDRTGYQAVTLKTGILFAIEPWNYQRARNLIPLPIRVLTGFHALNLTSATFEPSFVLGASLTAPILESGTQFGTSLAFGTFWEVDLREHTPFKYGNHVLLTFGLNLFSLGGASSNGK